VGGGCVGGGCVGGGCVGGVVAVGADVFVGVGVLVLVGIGVLVLVGVGVLVLVGVGVLVLVGVLEGDGAGVFVAVGWDVATSVSKTGFIVFVLSGCSAHPDIEKIMQIMREMNNWNLFMAFPYIEFYLFD
jgi:hypothetical protein